MHAWFSFASCSFTGAKLPEGSIYQVLLIDHDIDLTAHQRAIHQPLIVSQGLESTLKCRGVDNRQTLMLLIPNASAECFLKLRFAIQDRYERVQCSHH